MRPTPSFVSAIYVAVFLTYMSAVSMVIERSLIAIIILSLLFLTTGQATVITIISGIVLYAFAIGFILYRFGDHTVWDMASNRVLKALAYLKRQ